VVSASECVRDVAASGSQLEGPFERCYRLAGATRLEKCATAREMGVGMLGIFLRCLVGLLQRRRRVAGF
jgi:hypothetical protein